MKKIALLLKDIENEVEKCVGCGMCQAVCPLFKETKRETDVARGKIYILKSIYKNHLKNLKKINFNIARCLLCNSCKDICPRKVDTTYIFLKTRVVLIELIGLSYSKRVLLRNLLPNPLIFDFFLKAAINFQKIVPKKQLTHHSYKDKIITLPKLYSKKKRVALYTGCLIDKFFHNIIKKILTLLRANGFEVTILKKQFCCGMPSLALGDIKSFNRLIEKNIESFQKESFDTIVTACPTCTYAIKEVWKKFYTKDNGTKKMVQKISQNIEDINKFLFENLNDSNIEEVGKKTLITYHDPCHSKKSLKLFQDTRELIEKREKYEIVEMEDADSCCGMGGVFTLKFKKESDNIAQKKKKNIQKTGVSLVATSCPACILQLKRIMPKIDVKHSVELL